MKLNFLNAKFNYKKNLKVMRFKKYVSIIGMVIAMSSVMNADGKELESNPATYDYNIINLYRNRLRLHDDVNKLYALKAEMLTLSDDTLLTDDTIVDEVAAERKVVALTFDDGPAIHTDRLLDILEENNVKATFFVVGPNVEKYEDTVKKAYDLGHEIAIHGYTHNSFTSMSIEEVENEILTIENLLLDLDVTPSKLVRPPYGSINDNIKESLDYSFILWNVDTEDWKSRNKEAVIEEIKKSISEGSIILLHDIHSTTVDAMEEILPELIEEYEFVTIDELFERNEQELELHEKYYKVKVLEK